MGKQIIYDIKKKKEVLVIVPDGAPKVYPPIVRYPVDLKDLRKLIKHGRKEGRI